MNCYANDIIDTMVRKYFLWTLYIRSFIERATMICKGNADF